MAWKGELLGLKLGDHYVIDDVTGQKVPASETRKQWNGAVVSRENFEPRHPQDFVKGRPERYRVRDPRPRPLDVFVGPLDTTLTADALPGATSLSVASSVRMEAGDFLSIMLDNGNPFRVLLQVVNDASTITILTGLPERASSGNMVWDESAVAPAQLP